MGIITETGALFAAILRFERVSPRLAKPSMCAHKYLMLKDFLARTSAAAGPGQEGSFFQLSYNVPKRGFRWLKT